MHGGSFTENGGDLVNFGSDEICLARRGLFRFAVVMKGAGLTTDHRARFLSVMRRPGSSAEYRRIKALWNTHYPSLANFRAAIRGFVTNLGQWKAEFASLLTNRFHLIGHKPAQISSG